MAKYILAVDPRGYQVECSDVRFDYILNKHEETADEITESMVKDTIEKPDNGEIRESAKRSNCHIYYKKFGRRKAELKVVVEYDENFGELETFHLCSHRPANEEIIWPL